MSEISEVTLKNAHKPFDVVTDKNGNVGLITEVNCNTSQPNPKDQISYSITWLVGNQYKTAWWGHDELTAHCNLFIKIAEKTCHPMGNKSRFVERLFKSF